MNTNININKYKTVQTFKARLNHNNKSSRDIILYKKFGSEDIAKPPKPINETRESLQVKIDKLKFKLKVGFKKETTTLRNEEKLKSLIALRDSIPILTRNTKTNFVDISLSITKSSMHAKDKIFNKLLAKEANKFIKNHFKGLEIVNIVGHLDQFSAHVHISGAYDDKGSISKDLEQSFGKSIAYSSLQQKWNLQIKSSELAKKYNLKIDDIIPRQKIYGPLPIYKKDSKTRKEMNTHLNSIISPILKDSKLLVGYDDIKLKSGIKKALVNAHGFKVSNKELSQRDDLINSLNDDLETVVPKSRYDELLTQTKKINEENKSQKVELTRQSKIIQRIAPHEDKSHNIKNIGED